MQGWIAGSNLKIICYDRGSFGLLNDFSSPSYLCFGPSCPPCFCLCVSPCFCLFVDLCSGLVFLGLETEIASDREILTAFGLETVTSFDRLCYRFSFSLLPFHFFLFPLFSWPCPPASDRQWLSAWRTPRAACPSGGRRSWLGRLQRSEKHHRSRTPPWPSVVRTAPLRLLCLVPPQLCSSAPPFPP